jgi:hypothetical protein
VQLFNQHLNTYLQFYCSKEDPKHKSDVREAFYAGAQVVRKILKDSSKSGNARITELELDDILCRHQELLEMVDTEIIDAYVANFEIECEVCGQTPTVECEKDGKIVHQVGMCGPCTWGEAAMLEPDKWNE